eukprot:jgi/Botrbrau1/16790/Bobra.150_2s0019.1
MFPIYPRAVPHSLSSSTPAAGFALLFPVSGFPALTWVLQVTRHPPPILIRVPPNILYCPPGGQDLPSWVQVCYLIAKPASQNHNAMLASPTQPCGYFGFYGLCF